MSDDIKKTPSTPPPPPVPQRRHQSTPPPLPPAARPRRAAPRSRPRDEARTPLEPRQSGEEEIEDPTVQFRPEMEISPGGDPETRRMPRAGRQEIGALAEVDELITSLQGSMQQELERVEQDNHRARAVLLFELGHLQELVFRESEKALGLYEEAFSVDPGYIPAIRALRRRYRQEKRWKETLKALEAEAAVTADEEERSNLLVEMGELLVSRFSDTEAAIKCLRAATRLVPGQRRAAELLRDIHARLEQWDDLLEVLRGIANVTADAVERARLLSEMAAVCEYHLGRATEAEDLYTQALDLDPGSEGATVALRRLYLAHGRWKDLRDLLAQEAGRDHEPDERFADLYRAARISEIHLQDDLQAASLLETAAALRPGDPLPLQALTAIYQRTGRHEDQAAALARQLRLVRDPHERAALCYRLGRVQEDWLDRPEDAVRSYRDALKEQPGHEASLRALANLYETFERWEDLLDLELLRAERSRDVARRADGYVRAARISEWQVHDLRRAVDLYDRAYGMVAGQPEAFRALERIYRGSERWEPLAELYEREADATKDSALAVSLLRAAGRLHEQSLGNRERAIKTLERLLERCPDDRETVIHLSRLYEESGRVDDLRRLLEKWASATEDEQLQTELRRRVGELLEGPLRRTEQAVDVYRGILERVPADRPTMERLKAIFERSGRWPDLVDLLRAEQRAVGDRAEAAPLLLQIGQICRDKLGDVEAAQAAFKEALDADSGNTPALQALMELLEEQGLWERLVKLLGTLAERTKEPVRAAAVLCTAAEVCEERLREAPRAEEFYTRALELDPGNGPARHGLERLYQASGDRAALEAHYLREAEGTTNPTLRLRAYLRLGALFSGIGSDPVGAAAAYESALRVVEDQPDAMRSLAAIHRQTMSWDRLAAVLARIAGTSAEPSAAVSALKEWAAIVERHLSEQWDPAPIYERILDGLPFDRQALFALDGIAYARGAAEVLASLARRQVQAGGDPDLIASLCTRAAVLDLVRGEVQQAAEVLRRGLQNQPDYLPAVQLLRQLDETLEEWGEAAELMLREGELLSSPDLARAALVRAGNILLDRFGDVARARGAFERVFSEDPTNAAAFGRLAAILSAGQEWNALVAAYRRRMETLDPPSRIPLQLELASLYRDSLRDTGAAIDVLRDLLAVDDSHRRGLTEISELCIMQGRWREAEGYLDRLAKVCRHENAPAARTALLQRAQVLEEQLGDEEQGLQVLQALLADHPGDEEALARCLQVHQRRGDWEQAVDVLEELARSGPAARRINNLVNLAELNSRTIHDEGKADFALARAAKICVESGEGVDRITDYFERRGDFEGLVRLLGGALEELPPEGSPGSVNVRLARARILAGRLLQPTEAELEIRRALQSEPSSIPARLELAGLHLWGDNLGEATSEYMRVLEQDPFSTEAYRGLYRVYDRRGDMERAAGAAQAVAAVAGKDVPERKIAAQATAPMEAALSSAVATPLGVHDYWNLLAHPDEPQLARELLYLVADYIPAVVPHEVEAAGGGLVPLSPDESLAGRCSQLGQVMGVERIEVCLGHNRVEGVAALPGTPPRLAVDEAFAQRSSAGEFRFAVGRALADVLARTLYLHALQPRTVELLLAAVATLFERSYGEYLNQARDVEELARALGRAIPRKVRKMLEEPGRAYAAAQPVVFKTWYAASQRSAERAGLLLSGDVEAALNVLRREKASRAVQAELLRFTVGPHLYEARRRLGLSI